MDPTPDGTRAFHLAPELDDAAFERHVQEKAHAHLEACLEAEDDWEAVSPAYAPFDGCYTCIVREVLMVCWDEMWMRAKADAARELKSGEVGAG